MKSKSEAIQFQVWTGS